jgi:histone arginine demethylase JMJD6
MATAQVQRSTVPIARRHAPSYAEFVRDFLRPHKPVVITGALTKWKAMQWTPEYFRQDYPDKLAMIDGKQYRIADLIDLVMHSTRENPAPYWRNAFIDRFAPELLADIEPLPEYFSPNWLEGPLSQMLQDQLHGGSAELYIGGAGGKFPYLHFDACHTHAFICQIYGTKEFTCFSEDQAKYIYVRPDRYNASMLPDLENPDYNKFPLFAQATPMRFLLEPGEILFVPGGLWHTAKILSPSISVSVNRANASNWTNVSRDICMSTKAIKRPVAAAYLAGLRVFRTMYGS